tara:strand:- start:1857 stop:2093 length:237 start_codon:yes stop_codon:yes gene_type:complete
MRRKNRYIKRHDFGRRRKRGNKMNKIEEKINKMKEEEEDKMTTDHPELWEFAGETLGDTLTNLITEIMRLRGILYEED